MKVFIYILMAIAVVFIGVNVTKLDFSNLFAGDSTVALIGILASLCVLVMMGILLISRKIAAKSKR